MIFSSLILWISICQGVSSIDIYKNLPCNAKTCIPSFSKSIHELQNVKSVRIEAKTSFLNYYTIAVNATIDSLTTPSYVDDTIRSSGTSDNYFHKDSGLFVLRPPTQGHGGLSGLTFNVSHAGFMNIYSLEKSKGCDKFSNFWKCLNNSYIWNSSWSSGVSSALDELEFYSVDSLEETFRIVTTEALNLTSVGYQEITTNFIMPKGYYLAFESLNATVFCNNFSVSSSIIFKDYDQPLASDTVPFFTTHLFYKTYQPYKVHFAGIQVDTLSGDYIDVVGNSNFDVNDGILVVSQQTSGFFTSYNISIDIPYWHSVDNKYANVDFPLEAIVDGYFINAHLTSQALYNAIPIEPPSIITGPQSVIQYPDTSIRASLQNETQKQALFFGSIISQNWTLSVLPSKTVIFSSTGLDFSFDDLTTPSLYRLSSHVTTTSDVEFSFHQDITFVSNKFTMIKCLVNCYTDYTTTFVKLHLALDSKFPFGIESAVWSIVELDTSQVITSNVTLFHHLSELVVDTSVLKKKQYVVNVVVGTVLTNTSMHDDYFFNMSFPVFDLDCSALPVQGISLQTNHSVSCTLSVNGINCVYCNNLPDEDICKACLKGYVYVFRLYHDHETCAVSTPMYLGKSSKPSIDNVVLPTGDPNIGFITNIQVCLYDKQYRAVKYASIHVPVISNVNTDVNISDILDSLPDSSNKEQTFFNFYTMGVAFSLPIDPKNEDTDRIISILKNVDYYDDEDVSMQALSIALYLSKLSLSENTTEDVNLVTQKAYKNLRNVSKENAETATCVMLAIMNNIFEKNNEIVQTEQDIPDFNFVYATETPDKKYYNDWVNIDYEVEAKSNKDVSRSVGICSNIHKLYDWASLAIGKDLGMGEVANVSIEAIDFTVGKISPDLMKSGDQLVGIGYVYVPTQYATLSRDIIFTDAFSIVVAKFNINPCILSHNSDRIKTSVVGVNISLANAFKDPIEGFDRPIEVLIPSRKDTPMLEFVYNPINGFSYFELDIFTKPNSSVFLQIMCSRKTTVLIRSKSLPKALQWEFKYEFPSKDRISQINKVTSELNFSRRNKTSIFNIKIPFTRNDKYYVGVKVATTTPRRAWMLAYITSCLGWEDEGWVVQPNESVGILSNSSFIHCKFSNLTLYGADLSYPKLVAYTTPVARMGISMKMLGMLMSWLPIIIIYSLFFGSITTIHRLDARDIRSSNVLHSLSSHETAFSYKISIKTGVRIRAGTTSNVSLELHGSNGCAKADISQEDGELFNTNQTSHFVFYADSDIGDIEKVSVWINYSGKSPDWFLESVKLTDSKKHVELFIYNDWIGSSVGRFGCSIPRFSPYRVSLFKQMFLILKECLLNQHSAISSLVKGNRLYPSRKYLSTMFVARYLTLLCLITTSVAKSGQTKVTAHIIVNLVYFLSFTFPIFYVLEKLTEFLLQNARHNCLVTQMLTKSDSKDSLHSDVIDSYFWVTAPHRNYGKLRSAVEDDPLDEYFELIRDQEKRFDRPDSVASLSPENKSILEGVTDFGREMTEKDVQVDDYFSLFWGDDADSVSLLSFEKERPLASLPTVRYKLSPYYLRKTMTMLPYIVSVVASLIYLITMYLDKSVQVTVCIQYFGVALVLLIVLEQPLVCFITSLVHWYAMQRIDPEPETHCHTLLNIDIVNKENKKPKRRNTLTNPKAWKKVLSTRRRMNVVISKLFSYIAFIIVVVILSKQDRQTNCYYLNTSVRNVFATSMFQKIQSKDDFWNWIQSDYASSLSSEDFFENTRVKIPKEKYIRDSSSIIISISRMRQIRLKHSECSFNLTSNSSKTCTHGFKKSLVDEKSYNPKWDSYTASPEEEAFPVIRYKSYWMYQGDDSVAISGRLAKYPAGGYMVPLVNTPENCRKQLEMLQEDKWIDEKTRAVFIELSVYNPPTGFLCAVKLIVEYLPTGNVVATSQLHSINFRQYAGKVTPSGMKIEVVYIFCLLLLSMHEISKYLDSWKRGFSLWRGFWTVLDSCTLLAGWTSVCMYIDRYVNVHNAVAQFTDNPYYYIDFQKAAQSDIYFGYCLGALVFLVTVKIVDLVIVHVKVKQMSLIIHNSTVELASFGVPFFIILMIFSQIFYYVYSPYMAEFSTFSGSFGQTFGFILGEVNWNSMVKVRRYLTPVLYSLFGVLSITYLGNMFAVIVVFNTENVRLNPLQRGKHLPIFGHLFQKIKDVIFIVLPIVIDAIDILKRTVKMQNKDIANPYYVAPSDTTSSTVSSEDIAEKIYDVSHQNTVSTAENTASTAAMDRNRLKSIDRLSSKLKRQSLTLKKLNVVLKKLECRVEKLSGS